MRLKLQRFWREYWWLICSISFPVAGCITDSVLFFSPFSLDAVFIEMALGALWTGAAILLFIAGILLLIKKNFKKSVIRFIVPVLWLVGFIPGITFLFPMAIGREIGMRLHLLENKASYDRQLELKSKPRFVEFDEAGLTTAYHAFVYDESDEIMLPQSRRSSAFRDRITHTDLNCVDVEAEPLWDHYYYVQAFC